MFIKCVYYYLLYLLTFSYVKRLAPVSKKKKKKTAPASRRYLADGDIKN
ncbi:hypothetical protein TGS27_1617 [Geobacillus stearothermophilus]|nr:hypothetical protein TGS27_1617 [Geobacillus stearothermophilus]